MPKVKVNDIEMYYEVHGVGDPLVLLHGFFGSSQQWSPFIPDYEDSFQLIIPDLRGHGRSTNPSGEFTHRQSALDIYALLDHLNIRQFKAVGYSSGGDTFLHMATQQHDRVEAMVLAGATPYFPKVCREAMAQWSIESLSEERWETYRERHHYGDDQIRKLVMQHHDRKDSYDDMNFTHPYLSTITAKTLIIHGDRDPFFPVYLAAYMYEAIPDSYLWIIPNEGHALMRSDHVLEIMRVVCEFLTTGWEAP